MTNELKSILKGLGWCVFIALALNGVICAVYYG